LRTGAAWVIDGYRRQRRQPEGVEGRLGASARRNAVRPLVVVGFSVNAPFILGFSVLGLEVWGLGSGV